jgi:hypothetical protein
MFILFIEYSLGFFTIGSLCTHSSWLEVRDKWYLEREDWYLIGLKGVGAMLPLTFGAVVFYKWYQGDTLDRRIRYDTIRNIIIRIEKKKHCFVSLFSFLC